MNVENGTFQPTFKNSKKVTFILQDISSIAMTKPGR